MDLKSKTNNSVGEKCPEVIVEIESTKSEDKTIEKGKNGKIDLKTKPDFVDNNNFNFEEIEELVRRQFGKEFNFVDNQEALPPMETWFTSEKW